MVEIAVYYLRHMIIRRSILHTHHLLLAAMVCSLSIYAHASDDDSIEKISKRHLKIFTHGDTSFAKFDTERNASGLAMDTLQCISENLGFSYEVVFAPLLKLRIELRICHVLHPWIPLQNSPHTIADFNLFVSGK